MSLINSRVDLNTALCLACSSSIRFKEGGHHITSCCSRVICPTCIRSNPRLTTYRPCLACLSGVNATRFTSRATNLNHALVKDEELFVLGDDSDSDTEVENKDTTKGDTKHETSSISPHQEAVDTSNGSRASIHQCSSSLSSSPPFGRQSDISLSKSSMSAAEEIPRKYYIHPKDTMHGIALRFGVNARELCQLNKLPFSTLNTTPRLLHTRSYLELPASSEPIPLQYVLSREDQARRDDQRAKERAEKRLQMVTKEIDPRIAKAYVDLVEDPEINYDLVKKNKEGFRQVGRVSGLSAGASQSLEALAVDLYLEDEEWEGNERRAGHLPQIPRFPIPRGNPSSETEKDMTSKWWPWKFRSP